VEHSTIPAAWEEPEVYRIFIDALSMYYDSTAFNIERHPLVKLIVTSSVLKYIGDQAKQDGVAKALLERLHEAINQRRIEYMPVDFTDIGKTPGIYAPYADVLAHAMFAKERNPEDEVRLVIAGGGEIEEDAKRLGIQAITNPELKALVQAIKDNDAAKELADREQKARQSRRELIDGLIGLALDSGPSLLCTTSN
jgi:hypothetical protein